MAIRLTLFDALSKAEALEDEIRASMYGKDLDADARNILSSGAYDVAVGHFIAIRMLSTRPDVDSTIRALFRPLLEAAYRAAWILLVASDEDLEAVQTEEQKRGRLFPKLESIAESLDNLAAVKDGFFVITVSDLWLAHDFTHCGYQTIIRHYDHKLGIGPLHDEAAIAALVHRAVVMMGAIAVFFLVNQNNTPAAARVGDLLG